MLSVILQPHFECLDKKTDKSGMLYLKTMVTVFTTSTILNSLLVYKYKYYTEVRKIL